MSNPSTPSSVIERFREVHGDYYDYSEVEFDGPSSFVTVICPRHGKFVIIASTHWSGTGCRDCMSEHRKLEWSEFLARVREIYGDAYEIEPVGKISPKVTVEIRVHCKEHDEFIIQRSDRLLRGVVNCPSCRIPPVTDGKITSPAPVPQPISDDTDQQPQFVTRPAQRRLDRLAQYRLEQEQERLGKAEKAALKFEKRAFLARASEKHQARYDYSAVDYQGPTVAVQVQCAAHGSFWIEPTAHTKGEGCPECRKAKGAELRLTRDEFIVRSRELFGNVFGYDLIDDPFPGIIYTQKFFCKRHSEIFAQNCASHLLGHVGCEACKAEKLTARASRKRWSPYNADPDLAALKFVERARAIYKGRYDYSPTYFLGPDQIVRFICPDHGICRVLAKEHLSGKGCPKCLQEDRERKKANTLGARYLAAGIPLHWVQRQRKKGVPHEEILAAGYQKPTRRGDNPIAVNGVTYPSIREAHKATGSKVGLETVLNRLQAGVNPEDAFFKPKIKPLRPEERPIEVDGVGYSSIKEAHEAIGAAASLKTVLKRLKAGVRPEVAFRAVRFLPTSPADSLIEFNGVSYPSIREAHLSIGSEVGLATVIKRLKAGISAEDAFHKPMIRPLRPEDYPIEVNGVFYPTIAEAHRATGSQVLLGTVLKRLKAGVSPEDAFRKQRVKTLRLKSDDVELLDTHSDGPVRVFGVEYRSADEAIKSLIKIEQNITRRLGFSSKRRITVFGVNYENVHAAIAALKPEMSGRAIMQRLRDGKSPDDAFSLGSYAQVKPEISVLGVTYKSIDHAILAIKTHIPAKTIKGRIAKGMNPDVAFFAKESKARQVTINGVQYPSLMEAYRALKPEIKLPAIHARLKQGMSVEEAFLTQKLRSHTRKSDPEDRPEKTFERLEATDAKGKVIQPGQKLIAYPVSFHSRIFRNEDQLYGYIMERLGVSRQSARKRFHSGDMRPRRGGA